MRWLRFLGVLLVVACGSGPLQLPDGGAVWPDGGRVADGGAQDGGEDGGFPLCFFARADRLTAVTSALHQSPSDSSAVLASLPASAIIIPLANDSSGQSCQDGGFLEVQHLKAKGWVKTTETQDSTCHRGSSFNADIEAIVESSFGAAGPGAVVVSHCESGSGGTSADNGIGYFGLFQMGVSERATWGDSLCAEGQSMAANAYFVATGSDWSPWTCKPDGGH